MSGYVNNLKVGMREKQRGVEVTRLVLRHKVTHLLFIFRKSIKFHYVDLPQLYARASPTF